MMTEKQKNQAPAYWNIIWNQFKKNPIGMGALCVLITFVLIGLYAPLLASSKPIVIVYDGKFYFPLFRYLFFTGFYTKRVDLFYNLLMFTFPIAVFGGLFFKKVKSKWTKPFVMGIVILQIVLFLIFCFGVVKDPAGSPVLVKTRQEKLQKRMSFRQDPLLLPIASSPSWEFDLKYFSDYEKINMLTRYRYRKKEHEQLKHAAHLYELEKRKKMPTLFTIDEHNLQEELKRIDNILTNNEQEAIQAKKKLPEFTASYLPYSMTTLLAKKEMELAKKQIGLLKKIPGPMEKEISDAKTKLHVLETTYQKLAREGQEEKENLRKAKQMISKWESAKVKKAYLLARQRWLNEEQKKISFVLSALLRPFHWEDDAGGQQNINRYVSWWYLTRINRKDLVSALLFGVRISLVVGVSAVAISLLIGIPLGIISGYFAGKTDILIFRFIEIWEAMPTFFMLLLVVAIAQNKSIFLVVAVLGIFGWTGFGRFIRAETLKQRNLPYVMACQNLGFSHHHIMYSHILPNAIPPILTLLPFSMMAAITSEAGLSFLGLGEEGSPSWGVLMDEGRSVFPGESYLLWPPAILLTILLIAIALVGDALRDAIDPKMRQ